MTQGMKKKNASSAIDNNIEFWLTVQRELNVLMCDDNEI